MRDRLLLPHQKQRRERGRLSDFLKVDVQSLNALFGHLAEQDEKVFWMISPDYTKQLYVSDAYNSVWQRDVAQMYSNPASWADTLVGDNAEQYYQLLKSRKPQATESNNRNTQLYRIHTSAGEGQVKHIKDVTFYLYNELDQITAIAGLAEAITPEQWHQEKNLCCDMTPEKNEALVSDLQRIIKQELKLNAVATPHAVLLDEKHDKFQHVFTREGKRVSLTKRELSCLMELFKGKSAKQIAEDLFISPRTVESHISNIKAKLDCQNIVELVTKIKGFAV